MGTRAENYAKKQAEYEGLVRHSRSTGQKATLIKYNRCDDCIIEFEDTGYRYSVPLERFKMGCFKDHSVRPPKRKGYNNGLFYGIAKYDSSEQCAWYEDGKLKHNPYFARWYYMLRRVYNENDLKRYPKYRDCEVCEEWLLFSNFKKWMLKQDWEDKHLDKDIIIKDNKIYSPETCAFVTSVTNGFVHSNSSQRGKYMLGVTRPKDKGKYHARVKCPFTNTRIGLGHYDDEYEAHKAWQKRKHELACKLADEQSDERVAKALRERYAPDKDWSKI